MASRALGAALRTGLPWGVALTLGLLMPLTCIAHCLGFSAATPFRVHDTSGLQYFLCDHPLPSSDASGQGDHNHVLPRPVYEMVMFSVLIALAAITLTALDRLRNQIPPAFPGDAPPTPPPRSHVHGSHLARYT